MERRFRVAISPHLIRPNGTLGSGNVEFDAPRSAMPVDWVRIPPAKDGASAHGGPLEPAQVAGFDALLLYSERLTAATLEGSDRLALVARFGVGYDAVDVPACTRYGALLTITPDGVRRPVASSVIAFLLALAHRLPDRDRLTRAGKWNEARAEPGLGLAGRTLGLVGLGNIGREVVRLIAPFGMAILAYDPYAGPLGTEADGTRLVDLNFLLRDSDFVCITCPLNEETFHLLDVARLALMKPTAYVINAARGPIVDQAALTAMLRDGRLAGAALDVFENEPIDSNDLLLKMDNVILAPHAICWTDECIRGIYQSAWESIADVASSRIPRYVVNREALTHPRWQAVQATQTSQGRKSSSP
jgi:phosphoglycerate dehydrogenase-like enzyme